MNRLLKFGFVLVSFMALMVRASLANIVVDPTAATLTGVITTIPSRFDGAWVTNDDGKGGAVVANNGFFVVGNGKFTIDTIPDVTSLGSQTLPSAGIYTVQVVFTGTPNLTVTIEGVTQAANSGDVLTFTVTTPGIDFVLLEFSGNGNNNNFGITFVDVEAPGGTPEPRSALAVGLLFGAICYAERRRIGELFHRFSGRRFV
jgi:hypothetical protein